MHFRSQKINVIERSMHCRSQCLLHTCSVYCQHYGLNLRNRIYAEACRRLITILRMSIQGYQEVAQNLLIFRIGITPKLSIVKLCY